MVRSLLLNSCSSIFLWCLQKAIADYTAAAWSDHFSNIFFIGSGNFTFESVWTWKHSSIFWHRQGMHLKSMLGFYLFFPCSSMYEVRTKTVHLNATSWPPDIYDIARIWSTVYFSCILLPLAPMEFFSLFFFYVKFYHHIP